MTDRNILSFMTTNGSLLTDRRVKQLCDAGLDIFELSFDGLTEMNMSKKSGFKYIDIINRLIKYRKNYDFEITINMVISTQNFQELDDILKLIAGKRISLTTGLYIPYPLLQEIPCNDSLAFRTQYDLYNLKNFVNKILKYKKKGHFIVETKSYYKKWVPFICQFINEKTKNKPEMFWKCNLGPNFLEIDSDGRILYCGYLQIHIDPKLTIFDLNKNYYNHLKLRFLKMLNRCNARCLANCFYEVCQIRRHPLRFARETVIRHLTHLILKKLK